MATPFLHRKSDMTDASQLLHFILDSHIFGVKANVKNCVHYLNDQKILYAAGSVLVFYHVENHTQKYIPIHEGEITCLAVAPGETHIAVAVRTAPRDTSHGAANHSPALHSSATHGSHFSSSQQQHQSQQQNGTGTADDSSGTVAAALTAATNPSKNAEKPHIIIIEMRTLKKKKNFMLPDMTAKVCFKKLLCFVVKTMLFCR
jgi:hypothetical protein